MLPRTQAAELLKEHGPCVPDRFAGATACLAIAPHTTLPPSRSIPERRQAMPGIRRVLVSLQSQARTSPGYLRVLKATHLFDIHLTPRKCG
jgi:hypothetical protein